MKSEKELAFLRELYISGDWTERFTTVVDEHLSLPAKGKFLYFNSGTANHAIALREKLDKDVELFCVSENIELRHIAEDKTKAVKADISFLSHDEITRHGYDFALANASLTDPLELRGFIETLSSFIRPGGAFAIFVPTAGSFGEIFSYLWETLMDSEGGAEVEHLITDIPSVSNVEDLAGAAGIENIESNTKNELFDYETGAEFVETPLIADFLMPRWLGFMDEKKKEQASKKLAQLIDSERDGLSFRFSVKATLVVGSKA